MFVLLTVVFATGDGKLSFCDFIGMYLLKKIPQNPAKAQINVLCIINK